MLKAIKLDPKAIKKAILTVDTHTLPRFALVELLKLVPTEDELSILKQYESEPQNLASAERFMYEISEISKYESKLKAMHFKVSFAEYEDDAETMINALGKSAREVIDSEKFKEILRIILALGNYLNAGQRGGAYGFKLSSVLKV
jgi:Formin Homology 2 Domain